MLLLVSRWVILLYCWYLEFNLKLYEALWLVTFSLRDSAEHSHGILSYFDHQTWKNTLLQR